jgi:predicted transcriptional regulator
VKAAICQSGSTSSNVRDLELFDIDQPHFTVDFIRDLPPVESNSTVRAVTAKYAPICVLTGRIAHEPPEPEGTPGRNAGGIKAGRLGIYCEKYIKTMRLHPMTDSASNILTWAAQIVSAQVRHHTTDTEALPGLIREVYKTLAAVGGEATLASTSITSRSATGPRSGRQTAHSDFLECRECGLTMKMLKRHLITVHGMTPDQYRAKWKLPADHPMVAANYAQLRSSLAKQSGLGRRPESLGRSNRGRPASPRR